MIAGRVLAGCFAALGGLVQAVRADAVTYPGNLLDGVNTNFTFTDCAAPAEMQTCWNAQNISDSGDYSSNQQSEQCAGLESRISCVLTNCWNRVYSCDYQQLAIEYNETCTYDISSQDDDQVLSPDLPFFPPPDNAAGECSCNLAKYVATVSRIGLDYNTCTDANEPDEGDDTDINGDYEQKYSSQCDCCYYGAGNAAVESICPNTDPALLQRPLFAALLTEHNATTSGCPSLLSNFSCPNNGWGSDGTNASAWATAALPTATGLLTDVPGAIITSPVSGATYTWTGINSTYTITAAFTAVQATKTAASGSTSKISASGNASKTSSVPSSASSGAASGLDDEKKSFVALAAFAGFAFAVIQ